MMVLSLTLAQFGLGTAGGVLPSAGPYGLPILIARIIETALLLVGVIALGFLVYGGFKYMAAQGDERQIDEAKKMISGAVIGIVVIGLAFAIVDFTFCAVARSGLFC